MSDGRRTATIAADYFDALYRADPDPWRFRSSAYEDEKYRATLAMLGQPRYRRALEVGCSIGVFTQMLVARCEELLAIDGSEIALATAQNACASTPGIRFELRTIPGGFPPGPFDLIVLSEVVYYLTAPDAVRTAELCDANLASGGEIVLCHWLGETDYPLTGDEAVEAFRRGLPPTHRHDGTRHDVYRLDRFARSS